MSLYLRSASFSRYVWPVVSTITIGLFSIYSLAFILNSSVEVGDTHERYFCLFDDAMISLRYGWNWAHGLGPVWNAGERVEGYTNPLMMVLMAFVSLFTSQQIAPLIIQIAGVLFLTGSAFLAARIADQLTQSENTPVARRNITRYLAFLATLAYYPLVYWSLMGMETGLLTLLLTASVWAAFSYFQHYRRLFLISLPILLGLAYLTRPDALVPGLVVLAYFSLKLYKESISKRQFSLRLLLVIVIYGFFIVGQEVVRWWYYGVLVPNTYTLKVSGIPLGTRFLNGFIFVIPFFVQTFLIFILAVLSVASPYSRKKGVLLGVMAALVVYEMYVGGDPWNYWRMMCPAMPLLLILVADLLVKFVWWLASGSLFRPKNPQNLLTPESLRPFGLVFRTLTAFSLMLVCLYLINASFIHDGLLPVPAYQIEDNQRMVNTGLALREVTDENASLGVIWAGSLPYYSDRYGVDFLGKVDKHIAQLPPDLSGSISEYGMTTLPGHNKYDLDYSIKQLQPDYIQTYRWGGQDVGDWVKQNYVPIYYRGLLLLLHKDSPRIRWDKLTTSPVLKWEGTDIELPPLP